MEAAARCSRMAVLKLALGSIHIASWCEIVSFQERLKMPVGRVLSLKRRQSRRVPYIFHSLPDIREESMESAATRDRQAHVVSGDVLLADRQSIYAFICQAPFACHK